MRTVVTVYPPNAHLLSGFRRCADKFYPWEIETHYALPDEAKSEQLRRLLTGIDDEYIILLEEDFWIVEEVDEELLNGIISYCETVEADRFSLQSKNAHSYSDWDCNSWIGYDGFQGVYQTVPQVQVPFSLEASVWNTKFLLQYLGTNRDDGQIEMKTSDLLREHDVPTRIYALDKTVIEYRDAMRGGTKRHQIITMHDDPWRLEVEAGQELALYPQCGTKKTVLNL